MRQKSKARIIIKSKEVQSFVNAAMRYGSFIDEHEKYNRLEFLKQVHPLLALLYQKALLLPDAESNFTDEREITTEQAGEIFELLRSKLREWEWYWDTFNPAEATEETSTVGSNLADDLADIYQDLQRGFAYWRKGSLEAKLEAIRRWKFHFWIHTGQHINGALRAIFWRLCEFFDDEELEQQENETL